MEKKGKKYLEAAKLVDSSSLYSVVEAIELAKKTSTVNFDATVEVAFRLGVDTRKNDQQVRGAVVLPKGTGKTAKVLVFAKGDKAAEAEAQKAVEAANQAKAETEKAVANYFCNSLFCFYLLIRC